MRMVTGRSELKLVKCILCRQLVDFLAEASLMLLSLIILTTNVMGTHDANDRWLINAWLLLNRSWQDG